MESSWRNKYDRNGYTQLIKYVRHHSLAALTFCTHNHVEVNRVALWSRRSVVWYAAHVNNIAAFGVLLTFHPNLDVDVGDVNGITPLATAVGQQHILSVRQLIPHVTTSINQRDRRGEAPIHIAVKKNYLECLEWLLKHPQIDVHQVNGRQQTALQVAFETANVKAARMLGWMEDDVPPTLPHPFHRLIVYPEPNSYRRQCMADEAAAIAILGDLSHPIETLWHTIVIEGEKSEYPFADIFSCVTDCPLAVRTAFYMRPDLDINARRDYIHHDGATFLMKAVVHNDSTAVQLLLNRPDLDLTIRDFYGKSVMEYAVSKPGMISLLQQPRDTFWSPTRHCYTSMGQHQRLMAMSVCLRCLLPHEIILHVFSFFQIGK